MSEELIAQYREIHRRERYGDTSIKNLPYLLPLVDELKPCSIIDFGCGQSKLLDELVRVSGARGTRYDPAIPAFSAKPAGHFDLLINIDVLEHVPEEGLDQIIAEMAALADHAIIVVDTGPAVKLLPDGRNAHVSQHDRDWWARRLAVSFPYLKPIRVRSRRRAAFKTWRTPPTRRMLNLRLFLEAESRYRIRKLLGAYSPI
jgi:hypothetical protein